MHGPATVCAALLLFVIVISCPVHIRGDTVEVGAEGALRKADVFGVDVRIPSCVTALKSLCKRCGKADSRAACIESCRRQHVEALGEAGCAVLPKPNRECAAAAHEKCGHCEGEACWLDCHTAHEEELNAAGCIRTEVVHVYKQNGKRARQLRESGKASPASQPRDGAPRGQRNSECRKKMSELCSECPRKDLECERRCFSKHEDLLSDVCSSARIMGEADKKPATKVDKKPAREASKGQASQKKDSPPVSRCREALDNLCGHCPPGSQCKQDCFEEHDEEIARACDKPTKAEAMAKRGKAAPGRTARDKAPPVAAQEAPPSERCRSMLDALCGSCVGAVPVCMPLCEIEHREQLQLAECKPSREAVAIMKEQQEEKKRQSKKAKK